MELFFEKYAKKQNFENQIMAADRNDIYMEQTYMMTSQRSQKEKDDV